MIYTFLVEGKLISEYKEDKFVTAGYEVDEPHGVAPAWTRLIEYLRIDHVEPFRITMTAF
jgi:hypothetical protein